MRTALALFPFLLAACSLTADPPSPAKADPLGNGLRIAQVQNPKSPDYHVNASQQLTSTVVTWLDTYDETRDGKSAGTLYIQDLESTAPYAGIGIYEPNYIPASLTVVPGDVLDFTGPYQESAMIGTATFDPGTFLPQLYKPVGQYRYEYTLPPPLVVTPEQLAGGDPQFKSGRQWLGMLVTMNDVYVAQGNSAVAGSGARVTYLVGDAKAGAPPITSTSVSISNELYNLGSTDFPAMTHFKSVTGIVTWFFTFHVAPRSPADLVQ